MAKIGGQIRLWFSPLDPSSIFYVSVIDFPGFEARSCFVVAHRHGTWSIVFASDHGSNIITTLYMIIEVLQEPLRTMVRIVIEHIHTTHMSLGLYLLS